MVINFRTCGISRGAQKLTRTPTLKKNMIQVGIKKVKYII
jgi:hypothetical protein